MVQSRNAIYQALADWLQSIVGQTDPSTGQPYVRSISRVYRPYSDYASTAQLPAAVLDEKSEVADVAGLGVPALYWLAVDLWIYMPAPQISQTPGQETIIPADALNNFLDVLEGGPLSNPPSSGNIAGREFNTLGGLVQHVWVEGKIDKFTGLGNGNQPISLARVPIKIFTT